MKNISTCALLALSLTACGDDNNNTKVDAKPADAKIDQNTIDGPPDLYMYDEGGESRLEYQEILTPMGTKYQARFTDFFWKTKTPAKYPFVNIPGCTMMEMNDRFPLGMGDTHEYLDVGTTTHSGGMTPITADRWTNTMTPGGMDMNYEPTTAGPRVDGLGRKHDGHMNFFADINGGTKYLDQFDKMYDMALEGSADWPAQTLTGSHYMPSKWTLGTPGFTDIQLVRDTPVTITYTTDPYVNHPDGTTLNMIAALLVPFGNSGQGPAGALDLVVECVEEGLDGEIVIPAVMVNHAMDVAAARGVTGGKLARAHVSHLLREMYDGTTHKNRRVDFFTIWCYVTGWTVP